MKHKSREMLRARVEWLSFEDGGRKSIPPKGRYFAVSRFAEDIEWQRNAWSVVLDLDDPVYENSLNISFGCVGFLVDDAPLERMKKQKTFYIYEGAKKVATVFILNR